MKIQTINQLISVWKDIATRHYQINGFGIGDSWEVGADKAYMHPVLWINPVTATMPESDNGYKTFEIDFEVRLFDLVNKDESNENEVLSDTIDILKDIIAEFKRHPYYVNSQLNIIGDISFEAFTEEFDEEVSGWLCDISLMTPVLTTFCGIPSADITGFEFPGIDCPDFNVLCPVFVEDVTGVYPITVTTIGTTKQVSIDGDPFADTYVVSGSYSTGTLTLVRNDAVSINIGGFTDENDFTNNVTLTGNVLSFDRTDLLDAYSIDLTPILTGDVNTSSNSGTGEGLALPKVGDDLPFKSIKAGTNISITSTADEIEINSLGGVDTNLGNTDLTLTATRDLDLDGKELSILDGVNVRKRYYTDGRQGFGGTSVPNVDYTFRTLGSTDGVLYLVDGSGTPLLKVLPNGDILQNTTGNLKLIESLRLATISYWNQYNSDGLTIVNQVTSEGFFFNTTGVIGGTALVGVAPINLQDDTLIKTSDDSVGTIGFEVVNNSEDTLLDIRNNGQIGYGGDYLSTVGHCFRNVNNKTIIAEFQNDTGVESISIKPLGVIEAYNASGTRLQRWRNKSGISYFEMYDSGGTEVLQFTSGNSNYYSRPLHVGGATAPSNDVQLEITTTTNAHTRFVPMTAVQASLLTPLEGMQVCVSDTDGTFTNAGFWGYIGGAWVAFH